MRLMKEKQPEKPSWARSAELCRHQGGWILCRAGKHARADGEQDELTSSLLSCPQGLDYGTAYYLASVLL